MREENLLSDAFNKQTRKYDSSKGKQGLKTKNRLNRRFNTDRPYQKLVTDISVFRYGNKGIEKRVFLSPLMDLCSREIISFKISEHPDTESVLTPLKVALDKLPKLSYRTTIHSDQGIQYQTRQ